MSHRRLFLHTFSALSAVLFLSGSALSQDHYFTGLSLKIDAGIEKRLPNIFQSSDMPGSIIDRVGFKTLFPVTRAAFTRRKGIQSLMSISTGIMQIAENSGQIQSGLISSNGQLPTSNSFTVDGSGSNLGATADDTSISGNIGSLPTLTASNGLNSELPAEALDELTIKTTGAAKDGRTAGATINFSSKSGTNKFHGSVFETFGNAVLNANDFFANAHGSNRPASRLNQFGGTLSGPFKTDKSFFFANYEGLRLNQSSFLVSEVPDLSSRLIAPPNIRPILNAFALPNGPATANGFAEFAAGFTDPAVHDIFGLRVDNNLTSRFRIGGHYDFAASSAALRGDRDLSLNTLRQNNITTNSLSLSSGYVFTPGVVFEGRVNFSRNRISQQFSIYNFGGAQTLGLTASTDFTKFDFTGRNADLAFGQKSETDINQIQAVGAVDWIYKNQSLSFGTDFRRLDSQISADPTERSILFAGITQSLGETATRLSEAVRTSSQTPQSNNFSLYAQDEWHLRSNLDINLGLRSDMDFAPRTDPVNVSLQNASTRIPDQFKNFAPRLSLAFDPLNNSKSVLRGGLGLYYDFGNSPASESFANSFPYLNENLARNVNFTAPVNIPLAPLIVFDRNLKTPHTWQVYTEYQQEIWRNNIFTINYTGAFGRRLYLTQTFFNADPNFNFVRFTNNSGESNYNALQLRFERRFSNGFLMNARYTFSKSTDNFSTDSLAEENFISSDLTSERGASDFDVRHNLSGYAVYDIPGLFDSGWKKNVTNGWTISGFVNARTAFPVNVTYAQINDFGKQFLRPDLIQGTPLYLDQSTIKRLNPEAFSIPNMIRQGSLKRNALRGFPLFQIDATLQRRIKFNNEMSLTLTAQSFNVLNSHNFADMSANLGTQFSNGILIPNSYFGRAASTFGSGNFTPFYLYGGPRTIQFSAKFVF